MGIIWYRRSLLPTIYSIAEPGIPVQREKKSHRSWPWSIVKYPSVLTCVRFHACFGDHWWSLFFVRLPSSRLLHKANNIMKMKLCDRKGERATAVNAKLRMRPWRTKLDQGAVYLVWKVLKTLKIAKNGNERERQPSNLRCTSFWRVKFI